MRIALGLTTVSTFLAAVVAYGCHPFWAQYPHGLRVILLSRQAQWPALFLSIACALAVVALVIAGKRRAWWLIGLAPVMTLFAHRFATDPTGGMASVENPTFVAAAEASFVAADDFVVGLEFGGKSYAYPYAALYSTPAVIHAQHDKRILVMWSPTANRAVATTVKRELKARHLDVVSTPANALLLYDTARGQFINALTGQTPYGEKPPAFVAPVPTAKMPWAQWRALHPETVVMVPTGRLAARAPRQPLAPSCPMPKVDPLGPRDVEVVVVGTKSPAAVAARELAAAPVNLTADASPVLTFRDPRTQVVRAYSRKVDDLAPRFRLNRDAARAGRGAVFVDADTDSGWDAEGVAVDAKKEFRGKRLAPVVVEDGLYWGVMKHWYPKLELARVDAPPAPVKTVAAPTTAPAPSRTTTRTRRAPNASGGTRASPAPGRRSAGR